jgi:hypothetical protein
MRRLAIAIALAIAPLAVLCAFAAGGGIRPSSVVIVDPETQSGPPAKTLTLRLDGGLTFECLRIEPGRFMMGAPDSDKDA